MEMMNDNFFHAVAVGAEHGSSILKTGEAQKMHKEASSYFRSKYGKDALDAIHNNGKGLWYLNRYNDNHEELTVFVHGNNKGDTFSFVGMLEEVLGYINELNTIEELPNYDGHSIHT